MAVSKTQKLGIRMGGCRQDRAYKDYTSNPISTSSFSTMRLLGKALMRCRYGVTCVVFVYMPCLACTPPSLYLVSVFFSYTLETEGMWAMCRVSPE